MKTNGQIMQEAQNALQGKWGVAILAGFVYMLLTSGLSCLHYVGGTTVGVGGNLTAGAKTGDYASITKLAQEFVAKIKEVRSK